MNSIEPAAVLRRFAVFACFFVAMLVLGAIPGGRTWLFLMQILLVALGAPLLALALLWALVGAVVSFVTARPMGRATREAANTALAGAAALAMYVALRAVLPVPLPSGSHERAFDPAVWTDPASMRWISAEPTPRQRMLADTVRQLSGKSREQLVQMLGPPSPDPYFRDSGRDLLYLLGPERDAFFPIDSEWLLIWLDKDGRFERFAIASD